MIDTDFFLALVLPDPENTPLARAALVCGYLTAALCWRRASLQASEADGIARMWKVGAVLLGLLAINKTFDLRTQCEHLIRRFARASGWWAHRQPEQFFVAMILPAIAAVIVGAFMLSKGRRFMRVHPSALAGWLLLFLYLACRQTLEWKPASDWLISIHYFQWRILMEAAGLGLVIGAAWRSSPRFS